MNTAQKVFLALVIILLQVLAQSCRTVPVSGRQQLALLPESTLIGMSLTSYNEFISSNRLSTNQQQTELVRTTGFRIANAVEEYLRNNGMGSRIERIPVGV
jgi:hypothetical protein